MIRAIWDKVRRQTLKDYVLFPVLTGPSAPFTLAGNAAANLTRNVWAFTIIFCGHFPDGTQEFTEEETADETRGQWYHRQLLGSANLTGGKLFHVLSGNLSFQIEHHLFPDIPAHRYAEISVEVRAGLRALRHPVQHAARCTSSSGASCGRSRGWRCRTAARGRAMMIRRPSRSLRRSARKSLPRSEIIPGDGPAGQNRDP